ncbi:protein brambleberry-like [Cygnus atratus]|uniref:protein brambleberry-like n=1 Tax=Cygnus atratus TaxID=8868 RepID=UPI0015D63907|nr:protein brambleberry-like [Cygnus atratus]
MTTGDERFQAEGAQWELSPLDSCHRQVVARLRSSCADLSEEEVAKLGVALFNCQAGAEGRRTYPCTPEMPLASCTAAMDPDTWSAYHVVSNRARAVCYAARQLGFRRRAEHAVAAAASDQLDAVRALKEGHEGLRRAALSGQRVLEEQQERLAGQQGGMEASIRRGLRQRALEERLVDGGQRRVARLVEGVARSVGNISRSLAAQAEGLRDGRRAILADLRRVQERARDVSAQLESDLASLLAQRSRAARYFEEVAGTLQRLNRSLGLVLAAAEGVRSVQSGVEGHLRRFHAALAWAGLSPGAVPTCVLHGSYFLLLALLLAFLQAPAPPRALLLLLVGSSALGELRGAGPIGFPALAALLGLAVAGHWVLAAARRIARLMLHQAEPRHHLTSTPERGCKMGLLQEELDRMEMSCLQEPSCLEQPPVTVGDPHAAGRTSLAPGGWRTKLSLAASPGHPVPRRTSCGVMLEPSHGAGQRWEPKPYSRCQSLASSNASSLSPRSPCRGLTRAGQRCRKRAVPGQDFCHLHADGSPRL